MSLEAKYEWTQNDILNETIEQHGEGPGFFNTLAEVCYEAFGGKQDTHDDLGLWEFDMGELTVGQLLEFDGKFGIRWHNMSGGPSAYVVITDDGDAERFRDQFGINWLHDEEVQSLTDEDYVRAAGY